MRKLLGTQKTLSTRQPHSPQISEARCLAAQSRAWGEPACSRIVTGTVERGLGGPWTRLGGLSCEPLLSFLPHLPPSVYTQRPLGWGGGGS